MLDSSTSLTSKSNIFARDADADLVNAAFIRFKSNLKQGSFAPWKFHPRDAVFEPTKGYTSASVKQITVQQVASTSNSTNIDESYSLSVGKDGTTTIKAATSNGAMHGLNSLVQLFYATPAGAIYSPLAPVDITDSPAYPWRGLNIDIARNYEAPEQVKHIIDGLALNKFNRLHIHATDSQSWPIEIPSIPELANKGAYSLSSIWSAAALKDVQNYALQRGIDTIIEIDSPGHTASFHYSHPELIAAFNVQPWGAYCNEPPCGQAKLNSPAVTAFFAKIYKDLLPRVKPFAGYFHSGGDELNANVYALDNTVNSNDTKVIQPFLQNFVNNVHKMIRAADMKPIVWEEMLLVWNLTLPTSDVLVQTWQPASLPAIVAKGYRTLFGDYNYWYLDCGYGQWIDPNTTNVATPIKPPYTDYCDPQKSWREVYAYDPRVNITTLEQQLLEGGEVHLWGELTDPINLDSKLWPRAAAAGEIMWSGPTGPAGVNEGVTRRLADMRERLVGLGFQASMVQMTWCLQNEGSCSL